MLAFFILMYYIYILYSATSNKYYVGYTNDYVRRLFEHNNSTLNTFTSKSRPWIIKVVFQCGSSKSIALEIEHFIKNQKSRSLIEKLIDKSFIPTGKLAQLVRVP